MHVAICSYMYVSFHIPVSDSSFPFQIPVLVSTQSAVLLGKHPLASAGMDGASIKTNFL